MCILLKIILLFKIFQWQFISYRIKWSTPENGSWAPSLSSPGNTFACPLCSCGLFPSNTEFPLAPSASDDAFSLYSWRTIHLSNCISFHISCSSLYVPFSNIPSALKHTLQYTTTVGLQILQRSQHELKSQSHLGCWHIEEFPKSNLRTQVSVKGPGLSGEILTSQNMESDTPAWPENKVSGLDWGWWWGACK